MVPRIALSVYGRSYCMIFSVITVGIVVILDEYIVSDQILKRTVGFEYRSELLRVVVCLHWCLLRLYLGNFSGVLWSAVNWFGGTFNFFRGFIMRPRRLLSVHPLEDDYIISVGLTLMIIIVLKYFLRSYIVSLMPDFSLMPLVLALHLNSGTLPALHYELECC